MHDLTEMVALAVWFYIAWKAFVKWLDDRIATVAAAGVTVSPGPTAEEE